MYPVRMRPGEEETDWETTKEKDSLGLGWGKHRNFEYRG